MAEVVTRLGEASGFLLRGLGAQLLLRVSYGCFWRGAIRVINGRVLVDFQRTPLWFSFEKARGI